MEKFSKIIQYLVYILVAQITACLAQNPVREHVYNRYKKFH